MERWYSTSTFTAGVRGRIRATLLEAGRLLQAEHPEAGDPAAWTRQTCDPWIAALDRMNVSAGRDGQPATPPWRVAELTYASPA